MTRLSWTKSIGPLAALLVLAAEAQAGLIITPEFFYNNISCYQCNHVLHLEDCTNEVMCSTHEECFVQEIFGNSSQIPYYNMGCKSFLQCREMALSSVITGGVGKRNIRSLARRNPETRDVTPCHDCCGYSNCNIKLCTATEQQHNANIFLRIVGGGTAFEGTVQVYYNNYWRTICDDGWTDKDAGVVCNMLGYKGDGAAAVGRDGFSTSNSGAGWLENVNCRGNESTIFDCPHANWGVHNCSHSKKNAGVICPSVTPQDDMIFLLDHGLFSRMDLQTMAVAAIPISNLYTPITFDYDPSLGRIFFADEKLFQIVSVNFDGTDARKLHQLTNRSVVNGIAVDHINNLMIYSDAGRKTISTINLDGTGARDILTSVDQPRAIVLDARNQMMYWTDWGTHPKIEKAKYDGSQRTVLASGGLRLPNGLAMDLKAGLLYFSDAGTRKIESMDLNGNNRKQIYLDTGAHFFGLALTSQHIYYSSLNRMGLIRLNRDGSGRRKVGPPAFTKINALYAFEEGYTVY